MRLSQTLPTALLALFISASHAGEVIKGEVVSISDGDTLTVLDVEHVQHKIRLSGIDAPEKSQPFGQRSKQALAEQVFRKQVTVEWHKQDRYHRTVGRVITADGADSNLRQIELGMAWHYKQYQREQPPAERERYNQAEETARSQRIGLWQDMNPEPPWEFRHKKRH
ncbi:MAG: thermonuclease family protein [Rhodocyclaceae bacterium]|nr:thermonuclease family protein [Rhodocyclaceae bacterium]